jgi:cytidyltransferase-like protein
METIHFPDDPRPSWLVHPVLALGNFDGLHRGHLKIIERVKRGAAEHGGTPMAMTFDPHPPRVVRPEKAPPLLMTKAQRIEALQRAGIGCIAVVRFTHEVSQWDPETFVRTVLAEWLRVSKVWVGANFLFGHDRSGNFSSLRALGARYGFRAEKIDPVRYRDFVVSSTRIRRLVGEGRVDEAGAQMGHPYYIDGTVVRGRGDRLSDGEHRHGQRTAAAARRVCDDAVGERHREGRPHEHRHSADLRRHDRHRRDVRARVFGQPVRLPGAARLRPAVAGRTCVPGRGCAPGAAPGRRASRGTPLQPPVRVTRTALEDAPSRARERHEL